MTEIISGSKETTFGSKEGVETRKSAFFCVFRRFRPLFRPFSFLVLSLEEVDTGVFCMWGTYILYGEPIAVLPNARRGLFKAITEKM